ncbi:MAG: FHA domain-containing protein [Pseudohongiella sp.]|nr:FHA domain-containing protein [Pseudohongiella sp.]
MPIYRGPDGKIIEERTQKVRSADATAKPVKGDTVADDATRMAGARLNPARTLQDDDDTRNVRGSDVASAAPANTRHSPATDTLPDDRTVMAGGIIPEINTSHPVSTRTAGWLSIIKGPGAGSSLALGYGANSLGRAVSERVSLNFGDKQISRQGHAVVTYDPRGKTFYLQSGGGPNLTYLNEQLVLIPTVLSAGDRIQIGETTLHFTPLCGPDFDWQTILNEIDSPKGTGE